MACPRIEPGQAQRQPAVVRFLRVFCAFFAGPCRSTIGMQIPGVSHDLASSTLMAATGQGSAVRTGVTPMLEHLLSRAAVAPIGAWSPPVARAGMPVCAPRGWR